MFLAHFHLDIVAHWTPSGAKSQMLMKSPPGSLEASGGTSQDWQSGPAACICSLLGAPESCDSGRARSAPRFVFFLFLSTDLQLCILLRHVQPVWMVPVRMSLLILCPAKGPQHLHPDPWKVYPRGKVLTLCSQVSGTVYEAMLVFLTLA